MWHPLDMSFANQIIEVDSARQLACFPVHAIRYTEEDDPYRPILEWLLETGPHRNVFLFSGGSLSWRVADWSVPPGIGDGFVSIRCLDSGEINLHAFQGSIFRLDIDTGHIKKIGWSK
ncbi:MAG: hypothetical protein AAGH92_02295 [Planctomycetota bacterium]